MAQERSDQAQPVAGEGVTFNSASVPNARFDRCTLSSSAVRFYMLARLRGYAAIVEKKKV